MSSDVPFATVKFVTLEGKGFDLAPTVESIDVEDHDRAIDRARVVFDDREAKIAPIMREKLRVQISLGWSTENALMFEGIVMGHKTEAIGGGQQRVTVTAYDISYEMKIRPARTLSFNSGKLSDALKLIVKDYEKDGITVDPKKGIVLDDDPTFTPLDPLTKKEGQTDWDFVQELAEKYHARAFVEVNDKKSQFYFVSERNLLKLDPMGVLHYCPGGGGQKLVEFQYQRVGSGASPTSTVTVVDPKTGEPVTQKATPPPEEKPMEVDPAADAEFAQAAEVALKASQPAEALPKTVLTGAGSDPKAAKHKLQQDPTRLLGFYGTGTAVGTINLRAKGKVTIKGIAPWAEGDWYVHKVNHIYTRIMVKDKTKEQNRSTYQTKLAATR